MLGGGKITAMLAGETLEGSVARGCLQGGVLLPLLWSLGGWTRRRTQREWLLYTGVCRWHSYPHKWKNTQTLSKCFYRALLVWYNSSVIGLSCLSIHNTGRNIYILSDSQAAIKALHSFMINSKLAWDCHQSLVKLAEHNRFQLLWVLGDTEIEWNETADQLVRQGSSHPFIWLKSTLSITAKVARRGDLGLDK